MQESGKFSQQLFWNLEKRAKQNQNQKMPTLKTGLEIICFSGVLENRFCCWNVKFKFRKLDVITGKKVFVRSKLVFRHHRESSIRISHVSESWEDILEDFISLLWIFNKKIFSYVS